MRQKIEIIANGIYGADGEYPIGTTLDVDEIPAGWAGKVHMIKDKPADGAKPVTNPKKG